MTDPIADPLTALAARLSRRDALKTYAPPALAVVGAAKLQTFGTSGRVRSDSGRGTGPEGNPDPDPGNSAGHNNGGDGEVPAPGPGHVLDLLPMLANGTLAPAERRRVLAHVRRCPACRARLDAWEAIAAAAKAAFPVDGTVEDAREAVRAMLERADSSPPGAEPGANEGV